MASFRPPTGFIFLLECGSLKATLRVSSGISINHVDVQEYVALTTGVLNFFAPIIKEKRKKESSQR